ncbi:MAG: DUF2975 domain-containing protein [Alistipes sp.]
MQNKKSLLQRMLVIYITFFIVLVISVAHSFLPEFSKGYREGAALSENIVKSWVQKTPRSVFMFDGISVLNKTDFPIENVRLQTGQSISAQVQQLSLMVEQDAPNASPIGLALQVVGGSGWLYLLTILGGLSYLVIIVLMFLIIHSIRKSIKEERTLDNRNVWFIRTIGALVIFSELCRDVTSWQMNGKVAELLSNSGLMINTHFTVSYGTIILGILILFTAEVFAIGENLSEEQKLTI